MDHKFFIKGFVYLYDILLNSFSKHAKLGTSQLNLVIFRIFN